VRTYTYIPRQVVGGLHRQSRFAIISLGPRPSSLAKNGDLSGKFRFGVAPVAGTEAGRNREINLEGRGHD